MFKALIFDMDGVIIDSEPEYFQIMKRIMKNCGVEVSVEQLDKYIGKITEINYDLLKKL